MDQQYIFIQAFINIYKHIRLHNYRRAHTHPCVGTQIFGSVIKSDTEISTITKTFLTRAWTVAPSCADLRERDAATPQHRSDPGSRDRQNTQWPPQGRADQRANRPVDHLRPAPRAEEQRAIDGAPPAEHGASTRWSGGLWLVWETFACTHLVENEIQSQTKAVKVQLHLRGRTGEWLK